MRAYSESEVDVRLKGFPGSYSWLSGNLPASGWSQTPPNFPLSPCPGLLHQLPERGEIKRKTLRERVVSEKEKEMKMYVKKNKLEEAGYGMVFTHYAGNTAHIDDDSFCPYMEQNALQKGPEMMSKNTPSYTFI